jgi:hypothetical protein
MKMDKRKMKDREGIKKKKTRQEIEDRRQYRPTSTLERYNQNVRATRKKKERSRK